MHRSKVAKIIEVVFKTKTSGIDSEGFEVKQSMRLNCKIQKKVRCDI